METPSSPEEITSLTIDLPVYLLQHMKKPGLNVQEGMIQFLDERMSLIEDHDIHWDLRMGNALAVLCVAQHQNSIDLCGEIYQWLEDSSPYLQQKIFRLIECGLDASIHHPAARRWLQSITPGHPLHLPLTLLVAKSGRVDETLKANILSYWKDEPLVGVQLMSATKDEVFLQLVERELTWLAPFIRYIPLEENSSRVLEHELWIVLGEAWFNITYQSRPTPAWLNPTYVTSNVTDINEILTRQQEWHEHLDLHLMEKFGADLPWSREEWLKKIDGSPEFNRWKNRFLEVLQVNSSGVIPFKKRLQLVPITE